MPESNQHSILPDIREAFRLRGDEGVQIRMQVLDAVQRLEEQYQALHEAAAKLAHEHPDESWGYDGAGIHAWEPNEGEGTEYAAWVAKCPLCVALNAVSSPASEPQA